MSGHPLCTWKTWTSLQQPMFLLAFSVSSLNPTPLSRSESTSPYITLTPKHTQFSESKKFLDSLLSSLFTSVLPDSGVICHPLHFHCFLTPSSVSEIGPPGPIWLSRVHFYSCMPFQSIHSSTVGLLSFFWGEVFFALQARFCKHPFSYLWMPRQESLGLHPGEWLCRGTCWYSALSRELENCFQRCVAYCLTVLLNWSIT